VALTTRSVYCAAALALACSQPETSSSDAPRPLPADERPATVPNDWVAFEDWPGCVFWLPGSGADKPPPIAWEPCAVDAKIACRAMATPWSDHAGAAIAPDVYLSLDARGQPRLLVQRLAINGSGDERSYVDWVAGGADGPIDFALRQHWPSAKPGCWALNRDLSADAVALSLHGNGVDHNPAVDGLLVATFGEERPRVGLRNDAPGTSAWSLGAGWLVQNDYGRVSAYARDFARSVAVYDPSLNAQRTPFDGRPWIFGREILFQATDYASSSIWAYDEARGPHPLIEFRNDLSRGASNLGSDGKDIVWTQGAGRKPGTGGLYPEVSVMTATYTTDPARLAPRRLRRDLSPGIGTALLQFAVGCGHAGRPLASGRDVEIIRLSDGAGFVLRGSDSWSWERVLGFSCEEAFVGVRSRAQPFGVARVPLSALARAPD
jgi:hypothetical protein